MSFILTDKPFSFKNYPMTLSFYDKPITRSKSLNRFLSGYADRQEEYLVRKYFDLIIDNGGFFDINSFNVAMVVEDIVERGLSIEFGAGVFSIVNTDEFKDIMNYFGITYENYKYFKYEYVVSNGLANKALKDIKEKNPNLSDEDVTRLHNCILDNLIDITSNIKFLNGDALRDILNSANLQIRNDL